MSLSGNIKGPKGDNFLIDGSNVNTLVNFTLSNTAVFDGSTWVKKTGNKTSNGGGACGTIINIDGSSYWERKYDKVTPSFFGYDPKTGVGDAFAATKLALLVANSNQDIEKKDLFFEEGVYYFSSNDVLLIPNGVRVRGASKSRTQLYITATSPVTLFKVQNSTTTAVCYDNAIENLTIKNGTTVAHKAIELLDGSECKVSDIAISSDINGGYFAGIGINICGREFLSFSNCRIFADSPIKINPNANHSISIDHSVFRNMYLATQNVAGNKLVEIASGTNISNLTFDGYNSFIGGQYGIYYNDTTSNQQQINISLKNIRHEQEMSGGYLLYLSANYGIQTLNIEGLYGGLLSNFIYLRKAEKVVLTNCSHVGNGVTIDSIANNLNYDINVTNIVSNGTYNLTGYHQNKTGNNNYLYTYTDKNIISDNIITNSKGIGLNETPTYNFPVVIKNPLIGDATNGLMLGSIGAGNTNRSVNIVFNDFVDATGTYNASIVGERENINADWQGSLRFRLNTNSAPLTTVSGMTTVMQFNGRLRTAEIKDKLNLLSYVSPTSRTLAAPIGTLNFDATGQVGTQQIGELLQMTTAQINAIASQKMGVLLYDSSLNVIKFWNGTVFKTIATV